MDPTPKQTLDQISSATTDAILGTVQNIQLWNALYFANVARMWQTLTAPWTALSGTGVPDQVGAERSRQQQG